MPIATRPSPVAGLVLAALALALVACTADPAPTPPPTAQPTPERSVRPDPTPAASPTQDPDLFAGALPLPPGVGLPQGEFVVEPSSEPGLALGEPVPFDLGHCGLYSPVDVDGSLWEPVGGTDAQGGPIDSDAEVGDLINATRGEVMLVAQDRLDYRASRSGVVVVFRRLEGSRGYPACM
jgi:hypothetical protein